MPQSKDEAVLTIKKVAHIFTDLHHLKISN